MKWEIICFDLDNTLFSHESAMEKALAFCFHRYIKQSDKDIFASSWISTFKKYSEQYWRLFEQKKISASDYRRLRYEKTMKTFALPYNDKEADHFHKKYYESAHTFSQPYEGLHSLMRFLVNNNISIGVITNGTVDTQYRKIEKLEISSYLLKEHIFISEEIGFAKPDIRMFDFAKKRLGQNGKALFVGDSWEHDIIGAIRAGWDAIYLNTRNKKPTSNEKPIIICRTFKEMSTFICAEYGRKG